jgi:AraC-like DNA-binding protein
MIVIPQRLFSDSQVKVILRDGNVSILKKKLAQPLLEREGYISNHVISILLAGEQRIRTFDDQLIKVRAGQILFIPRGLYYISDLLPQHGAFESLLFYFDDRLIQEFLSVSRVGTFQRQSVPSHLKCDTPPAVELFARSLLTIYEQHGIRQKQFLDLKILELLHLLSGLVPAQEFADFLFQLTLPKKRNIKFFMQKNFDKPLKIEDYAYLTGRSPSSFRRDFKQYFATTPQKWIKQKRLEKAHQLLLEKTLSVTDLAYAVGYEHVSYFIKEFKGRYGVSPKQMILENRR